MTRQRADRRQRGTSRWIAAAVVVALGASPVAARTSGIVGYSGKSAGLFCSNAGAGCHVAEAGTMPPLVRFEGPSQVDPDTEVTYRFVVTSQVPAVQIKAGFNVAASAGALLVIAGQREKLQRGELTHTGPKDNDENGEASWQFTWRAPSAPGEYVLFGAGNSVNDSSTEEGDQAEITTMLVNVGDIEPTPTPLPAGCAGDCDGDGMVAINELISGVNIALGTAPVTTCAACDANDDGSVSINELIAAVTKALNGC